MFHHGTIKKYTAALLDLFNNFEIQTVDSNGNVISKNIPIKYAVREKATIFDDYTTEQILSGNHNVLPRSSLSLVALIRSDNRITNKNMKINIVATEDSLDYMYNSVPYELTYELNIQCRGMNEATMIIEQILPKFNPIYNIDIYDAENLSEPTRVPVKLLDVSIQAEDYEELSTNIILITMSFSVQGNMYPPIKSIDRIKEFKILINETDGNYFNRKSILGWDVEENRLTNETVVYSIDNTGYAPHIVDIVCSNFNIGLNNLSLIYDDKDNKFSELSFEWVLLQGTGILIPNDDVATLEIEESGDYEIQITITDVYGNYTSLSKIFTI